MLSTGLASFFPPALWAARIASLSASALLSPHGLREVLSAMLAWARMVGGCRAGACFGRGDIVGILLVIEDQHHFTGEPVEIGHLLRLLAVVMVGYQLLYGFPALSDRAS